MKKQLLITSILSLLNCGQPEQFHSQEAPEHRQVKVAPVMDKRLESMDNDLFYDKKLDIYCRLSNDTCLPLKPSPISISSNCSQEILKVFYPDPKDDSLIYKIKYTEVEGKFYRANIYKLTLPLYEVENKLCTSKGDKPVFLVSPQKEVDVSIFANLHQ